MNNRASVRSDRFWLVRLRYCWLFCALVSNSSWIEVCTSSNDGFHPLGTSCERDSAESRPGEAQALTRANTKQISNGEDNGDKAFRTKNDFLGG